MIKVSLQGIKGLEKAIKGKSEALVKGIDMEMEASIKTINGTQKQLAPKDNSFLASSLDFKKISILNYKVFSEGPGSSYAPYQEFGTGGLVRIPQGLEAEAAQYKGKGIRQINMRPQPFFFAPAFAEWNNLKKRIEKMLNK